MPFPMRRREFVNRSVSAVDGEDCICASMPEGTCERSEPKEEPESITCAKAGYVGPQAKRAQRRSVLLRRKRAVERASEASTKRVSPSAAETDSLSERNEGVSFCGGSGLQIEQGERKQAAHALCRTCALPHMPPHPPRGRRGCATRARLYTCSVAHVLGCSRPPSLTRPSCSHRIARRF
jgi:hypothetical protein